jgi:hypothetical protein
LSKFYRFATKLRFYKWVSSYLTS